MFSGLLFLIGLVFAGGALYTARDTNTHEEDRYYRVGVLVVVSWAFLFASNVLNVFGA